MPFLKKDRHHNLCFCPTSDNLVTISIGSPLCMGGSQYFQWKNQPKPKIDLVDQSLQAIFCQGCHKFNMIFIMILSKYLIFKQEFPMFIFLGIP